MIDVDRVGARKQATEEMRRANLGFMDDLAWEYLRDCLVEKILDEEVYVRYRVPHEDSQAD